MASQVMRITLKAYDHQLVDASAGKIIETVKKNGATVSGPVPLPTKKEVVTSHYISDNFTFHSTLYHGLPRTATASYGCSSIWSFSKASPDGL